MASSHLRDLRIQAPYPANPTGWWPCVALGEGDLSLTEVLGVLAGAPRPSAWLVESQMYFPAVSSQTW